MRLGHAGERADSGQPGLCVEQVREPPTTCLPMPVVQCPEPAILTLGVGQERTDPLAGALGDLQAIWDQL